MYSEHGMPRINDPCHTTIIIVAIWLSIVTYTYAYVADTL